MAKSKLTIQINAALNPFGNSSFSGDWIGIDLNDGNENTFSTRIHETPSLNRTVKGLFISKHQTNIIGSAIASKFSNDWGNVGGNGNVKVTYRSGQFIDFELQNELWTFEEVLGQAVDNGKVTVVSLVNADPPTPNTLSIEESGQNSCSNNTIEYTVAFTGGVFPYKITGSDGGDIINAASPHNIDLIRGQSSTIEVYDSFNQLIGRETITPLAKLEPSYYNINSIGNRISVVENVNIPDELQPIDFAVNDGSFEASISPEWQAAGSFSNLEYETNYTLMIRDKYGCILNKEFAIGIQSATTNTYEQSTDRYVEISNAGTLILVEQNNGEKRNFTNELSCEEIVNIPYKLVQEFTNNDPITQQFKSSYTDQRITLVSNGQTFNITPVLQSENLGFVERVDCMLFKTEYRGLGIYFRNGNKYIQETTTVNGVSDYDSINLPSWAITGQYVVIEGIGEVKIKRISQDDERGLYLETDTLYGSSADVAGIAQVRYDKQPYNTYEFRFNTSLINSSARLFIEFGFNGLIEKTFTSECISIIEDDYKRYLFRWGDPYNKAGIVHQTGISHFARLYASFIFKTESDSETYRGDGGTFNVEQNAYRQAELKIAVIGHMMENKLHLASGMEVFNINGINYRKTKMSSENVEGTNYYIITATLETGGNLLNYNTEELVLNTPLSLSNSGKTGVLNTDIVLLARNEGGLILNGSGGFVIVDNS